MKKIKVLVPSAGHPTRPSLLKCLKDNGERQIDIVGVDMEEDGLGQHIVDFFYHVPPRTDPLYIDRILEICKKEKIDVYYALGEEEAMNAVKRKKDFDNIKVSIISPGDPEMVEIATNKCRYHDYLKEKDIPHARYSNIYSYESIERAVSELGYPEKDVFVKPAVSKGGRGARILTSRDISSEYYKDRSQETKMSLPAFMDLLAPLQSGEFHPILAMEYLPGTYYSVDVLSEKGKAIYVIPKIRIQGSASNTTVGQVDLNEDTIKLATSICEAFNFSYLQNYEMKLNANQEPMVYDINPRGGASIALCAAAGVNIAYFAVKMALREKIPERKIKNKTMMIRFYDEYYKQN